MQVVPVNEYLTRDERKLLMQKNDFLAWKDIILHYIWIVGAFALVHFFPNIFTVIISLFVIGGKQLACAILMHDTGHHAVFTNKKLNDFVGQWLGGYPIFNNLLAYRDYHFKHHQLTGLEEDPDLLLTRGYPTSRMSMIRKFIRDFIGITGVKALLGITIMNLGYIEYNMGGKIVKVSKENRSFLYHLKCFRDNLLGPIIANLIMFSVLWFFASPWLYLLWIGAYLTTFQFCIRVRSIAEHSVVEDTTNPYLNTRTTKANWLAKMLFAPYHVNYHAEHHMLMSVPSYRLPKMHKILVEKGFYEKGVLAKGYWSIIKMASAQKQRKIKT
ncbi:fatty acid desaturase family protein [Aquimarina sp. 2304DJ70-9]|uniref:fatty acid desaturase family protein n=1 Tax=Aquimarina penaris TaxID=3231044 RepID=UPI003462798B